MKKLVRSTCLTIVFVLSVYIGRSLCDESRMEDYDPVERILRERGLKSPHEVKNTRQPLWEHHGKDGKSSSDNTELKNLQQELRQCNQRSDKLRKELAENAVNESSHSLQHDVPYLKQIFRSISGIWTSSSRPSAAQRYFKFKLENDSVSILDKCLEDKEHFETCMDVTLGIIKTAQEEIPSEMAYKVFSILEKVDLIKLSYVIIAILCLTFSVNIVFSLLRSKSNVLGMIFILLWASFLVSVPWEWMRLYKEAISRKTAAKMSVSSECFGEKMSYISLMKYWLQNTFSFSDDECLKYYNAEIIDPFWEVTPGQALAAATSRIILQPTLILSDHIGKCFRLVFKDIPLQWQLPVFLFIIVLILLAVGVEIGGPLLQVGRNVQAMKGQLRAEQAKNKELREQIEQLNRRLVPMQNGDGRRDEIQPSGIQPQAPVQVLNYENYFEKFVKAYLKWKRLVDMINRNVENIPQDLRNIARQPVENAHADANVNKGRGLHDGNRHKHSSNVHQHASAHQETETPSYE